MQHAYAIAAAGRMGWSVWGVGVLPPGVGGGMFGVRGVPNQILNPYLHMKNLQTFCNIDLYTGLGNKKKRITLFR